jgi:hypothetical protein
MQRHVDPRRDARGRHDVAVVDEAIVGPDFDVVSQ